MTLTRSARVGLFVIWYFVALVLFTLGVAQDASSMRATAIVMALVPAFGWIAKR